MANHQNSESGRRDFLKKIGIGAAAITGAALTGCDSKPSPLSDRNITVGREIPKGQMTYRNNPKTGQKVSLLGYGCMRWPTINDGENKGELDQEAINRLVDAALAHGVNYFDTAPVYCKGKSERATGIALKRHPRDSYYIATKLSNFGKDTWEREAALSIYHNSFKELQTDYIDYLLMHNLGRSLDEFNARFIDNGVLDYLVEERAAGRIRNLGWSFHGDVKVFDHLLSLHDKYKWDFVQIQMNYMDWQHPGRGPKAEYLYTELEKRVIPVVIMEPLLGGRLASHPSVITARFKQREPERSVASWAFRFVGSRPGVMCVLSGMSRMEHLLDNLHTYSPLKPLTAEDDKFVLETADMIGKYPIIPCTDCKYCMPCPYGLDIPAILRHYNKCLIEENIQEDTRAENYREARRAFLVGYDRSVPKLRQANHCIGCGKCMSHCPQKIRIPKELQRIDKYVEKLKRGDVMPISLTGLTQLLREGNHSLAVANGPVRTFNGRGVSDLYNLLTKEPDALKGAKVADKVVGKGAAALMILGGVKAVHALLICDDALKLFDGTGIRVTYDNKTPMIKNATQTGLCPIEACCKECHTPEECLPKIKEFIESHA